MYYSAFGNKQLYQAEEFSLKLPWRFANRREIEGLVLFTHRLYHPNLMRWLTPDPAGFIDSLNLYTYVHNNPFCYKDKDGRFAFFVLPVIYVTFGTTGIAISAPTVGAIAGTIVGAALGWGVYEACKRGDKTYNQIEINEQDKQPALLEPRKKPSVRKDPKNLEEQLSLEEAKNNPSQEIKDLEIKDPNYPKEDWKKCEHVHRHPDGTNTDIHFWENRHTEEREGFKFKDYNTNEN